MGERISKNSGKEPCAGLSIGAGPRIKTTMEKFPQVRLLKRLLSRRRDMMGTVMYWSGLACAYEIAMRPSGAIILMYHSVAESNAAKFIDPPNRISPEMFERQMAYLSKYRRVVPLSQVVEQIASGSSPTVGTVCITFDDGYLDNLKVAAPILERYGLPATLYLPTTYIERSESQWADRLFWMLNSRTMDSLSIPSVGLTETNLASFAGRETARSLLHRYLLESDYDNRAYILNDIELQLRPMGTPPRLTMNWDEVRELKCQYPFFDIGGHTRGHIDLRTHRGELAREQIDGCAEDLRRELGHESMHFSFPYSRWCQETRDAVSQSSWKSAVGMGDDLRIRAKSDLFAMPRVESPRTMTLLRFMTSGAYPGVLRMAR